MIGIFGGTFDPVHYGHLRTAVELKALFALQEIRLIPCANPPHRSAPLTSPAMRLNMLQLALANHTGLVADGREIERAGPSYTVDTLQALRAAYGTQPLLLFMGMDAFVDLERWHQWLRLFDYAHIVVITRPGYPLPQQLGAKGDYQITDKALLEQSPGGRLFFQPVTSLAISATAIRDLIGHQQDPSFLLPDSVIEYIRQHKLYQTDTAIVTP